MEKNDIEYFDRARFNMKLCYAIGWGLWMGLYILNNLFTDVNDNIKLGMAALFFVFSMIYCVLMIKIIRINKKIQADPDLKAALDNEYYSWLENKAMIVGFYVFGGVSGVMMVVSVIIPVSTYLACLIISYLGVLSTLTASVIFHRK